MWLVDIFRPAKADQFFTNFKRQASIICEAARVLERYFAAGDPADADAVGRLEHEGDGVVASTIEHLSKTFVTPIDRQDIFNLAEALDDMLDYINNAVRELRMFDITASDRMKEMTGILRRAGTEIEAAVGALTDGKEAEAREHARNASHAENEMEKVYREALRELFEGDDVRAMLRMREIYRHLSNSADRADAIGRIIGGIVVKAS